jgi:hypothetical protein
VDLSSSEHDSHFCSEEKPYYIKQAAEIQKFMFKKIITTNNNNNNNNNNKTDNAIKPSPFQLFS